jgi:hypothetical protein
MAPGCVQLGHLRGHWSLLWNRRRRCSLNLHPSGHGHIWLRSTKLNGRDSVLVAWRHHERWRIYPTVGALRSATKQDGSAFLEPVSSYT